MQFMTPEAMMYLFAAGWFFDNVLANVPAIKSNSVFQLLCNVLDSATTAVKRKK
jgi:hypothetical protein